MGWFSKPEKELTAWDIVQQSIDRERKRRIEEEENKKRIQDERVNKRNNPTDLKEEVRFLLEDIGSDKSVGSDIDVVAWECYKTAREYCEKTEEFYQDVKASAALGVYINRNLVRIRSYIDSYEGRVPVDTVDTYLLGRMNKIQGYMASKLCNNILRRAQQRWLDELDKDRERGYD